MVGDRRTDVTFGHALGLKTVFVLSGYGLGSWEHQRDTFDYEPDHVANDLAEAVDWILEDLALSKVSDEIRREKA
jgi:D-glycero-D-manno-heptose 1,7-bisphosphate phosphatase